LSDATLNKRGMLRQHRILVEELYGFNFLFPQTTLAHNVIDLLVEVIRVARAVDRNNLCMRGGLLVLREGDLDLKNVRVLLRLSLCNVELWLLIRFLHHTRFKVLLLHGRCHVDLIRGCLVRHDAVLSRNKGRISTERLLALSKLIEHGLRIASLRVEDLGLPGLLLVGLCVLLNPLI